MYESFEELLYATIGRMEQGTTGASSKQAEVARDYLIFFKKKVDLEYYKQQVDEFLQKTNEEDYTFKYYGDDKESTYFQQAIGICEELLLGKLTPLQEFSNVDSIDFDIIVSTLDFIKIVTYINDNTQMKLKLTEAFTTRILIQTYSALEDKSNELDTNIDDVHNKINDDRFKINEIERENKRQTISNITTLSIFSAIVISIFGGFEIVNTTFINFEDPLVITLVVFFAIYNIVALLVILVLKINKIPNILSRCAIITVNIIFVLLIILFHVYI